MNVNEYQYLSQRTMNSFSVKEGLPNYCMGLAGESGEVVDYCKKAVFHGHELNKEKVAEELGDVLFYLSAIATVIGYKLGDIAEMNVEKLRKRYPTGFSTTDSIKRVDVEE